MVYAALGLRVLSLLFLFGLLGCGSDNETGNGDGGAPWFRPPRDAGAPSPVTEPDGGWFRDDGGFWAERYESGEEILCDRYRREDSPRCVVGEERCCQRNHLAEPPTCIDVNATCHWSSMEGYCDGPEDCAEGMICCIHVAHGAHQGELTNTCEPPQECLNRRAFSIICRSDADCITEARPNCCFGGAAIGFVCYPEGGPYVGTCDIENFEPKDNPDDWY